MRPMVDQSRRNRLTSPGECGLTNSRCGAERVVDAIASSFGTGARAPLETHGLAALILHASLTLLFQVFSTQDFRDKTLPPA